MNSDYTQMEIGKRIAECRREQNFTQEELANRIGVTPQALSQYERGMRYPDIDILRALCNVLGVSSDYMIGTDETKMTESNDPLIQNEIWKNLRNSLEPLALVFGADIVPAMAEAFSEDGEGLRLMSDTRLKLSKEGILLPIVKLKDWTELKPREFVVLAYDNVVYQEIISEETEITADYLITKLEETVRTKYDEFLNVSMIKDMVNNLRINHSALIDGIIPEKISYGQILAVCKEMIVRGNSMIYFPRILEFMEEANRSKTNISDADMITFVVEKLERKDNKWVWLHDH